MEKYLISQTTSIISIDDINMHFVIENQNDKDEKYTVLRKINNIESLKQDFILYNIASIINMIKVAKNAPDKIDIGDKNDDINTIDISSAAYRLGDDRIVYIENIIDGGEEKEDISSRISKLRDKYGKDMILFNSGKIIDSEANKKFIKELKIILKINKMESPSIIIKEGITDELFNFDKKLYECAVEIDTD